MPLSKARQAEYMREYRKRKGSTNSGITDYNVIPNPVQPKKEIAGVKIEGNRIVGVETRYNDAAVIPKLPICNEYNFNQFSPGDKVLVRRGKRLIETVIPELDADGHPVPQW